MHQLTRRGLLAGGSGRAEEGVWDAGVPQPAAAGGNRGPVADHAHFHC